jgi:hypothetical protein
MQTYYLIDFDANIHLFIHQLPIYLVLEKLLIFLQNKFNYYWTQKSYQSISFLNIFRQNKLTIKQYPLINIILPLISFLMGLNFCTFAAKKLQ